VDIEGGGEFDQGAIGSGRELGFEFDDPGFQNRDREQLILLRSTYHEKAVMNGAPGVNRVVDGKSMWLRGLNRLRDGGNVQEFENGKE
jgi:hypothetical protein